MAYRDANISLKLNKRASAVYYFVSLNFVPVFQCKIYSEACLILSDKTDL